MHHTANRFTPVVLFYFLALICMTISSVLSVEAEAHSWNDVGKDTDALDSLLSKLQMGKLQNILKNMPPAELQRIASRLHSKVNLGDTETQKKNSILEAVKAEGLLDSWKNELDSMIFNDNVQLNSDTRTKTGSDRVSSSEGSQMASQIEEAVHKMLGNTESNGTPSTNEQIGRNDVDYLFQEAEEIFEKPSENLKPPKLVRPPYPPNQKPSSYPSSGQERRRGESIKKPSRKNDQEPLDALVGMAKKFLGQDENDPTLDLVANMATAYIKNMDTSKSPKKTGSNSGPDINAMLQLASLLSTGAGGGGKTGGNGSPDLSSLLQLASLFSGDNGSGDAASNPLQSVLSLLSNSGMDMNQLMQMGSMLMSKGSESSVSRKSKSASPMIELVLRFVANWLEMDPNLVLSYYDGLSDLVGANSWNEINRILRRSTGTDVETMLDMMANDDVRQQISDSSTAFVAHWLRTNVNPDSFQERLVYANALLQQYNYPLIDSNNEIESLSRVVERLSTDFLNLKIDLRPYLKQVETQLKDVLHIVGPQKLDFRNFSEEELSLAVRYTMKNEVFDPLAELWSDFRLASRVPRCARTILCRRNIPSTYKSPAGLREGITRGASTVVVWALSKTNNRGMPPFDTLYKAAFDGTTDCEEKYRENCDEILKGPLPSLSLDFEHNEL